MLDSGWLLGFGCIFLLGLIFFRKSVAAGLLAFLCMPALVFLLQFRSVNPADKADTVTTLILAILVLALAGGCVDEESPTGDEVAPETEPALAAQTAPGAPVMVIVGFGSPVGRPILTR